jgi:methionyl aminopeptidase
VIEIKSKQELETMNRVNRVVRQILSELEGMVAPGVSTMDLEVHAERRLKELGARSAFKGYALPGCDNFPAVLCASINDEVVHGIPSRKRTLREGDILSLDFGAVKDGLYGDSAMTIPAGRVSDQAQDLIRVVRESLDRAIDHVRPGATP